MSSPFRASDSKSTPKSSPSRQRFADSRNGRVNEMHRLEYDRQSRAISRLLEEFSKVELEKECRFKKSLDAQTAEQERLQREALELSFREHEAVRQSAERARERVELEIQRERLRREEEEKRAVEKARRELAEQEAAEQRRQLEVAKRQEDERKQREALERERDEQSRKAEEQKQRTAQEEAQRKAAREKEAADKKARDQAAARERQQQAQQPAQPPQATPQPPQQPQQPSPQTNGVSPAPAQPQAVPTQAVAVNGSAANGLVSTLAQREAQHQQYMDLHKRLKVMRSSVNSEFKATPPPGLEASQLSDWRREIRKYCGQIKKVDRKSNQEATRKINAILDQAARLSQPTVDISQYIISAPVQPGEDTRYPAALLFLLNMFAKFAISQLLGESSADTETADPIGIMVTTIFSQPQYRWSGHSLIDVLWAKYHVVCPPLFGISGPEKTTAGRRRLGWWREDNEFITAEQHYTRMTGLGAGFSAITLRDFSKSRNQNPAPNRIWWESMARIINLPKGEAQLTHYILVKAMIDNFAPRIIQIFANAGRTAIKTAVRDFPEKGPEGKEGKKLPAVVAVKTLEHSMQQKYGLTL